MLSRRALLASTTCPASSLLLTSPSHSQSSLFSTQHLCAPRSNQPLQLSDLPSTIVLLRHGESAGLKRLQEELQIPNHRVPLSTRGVAEARAAGAVLQRHLLPDSGQQPASRLFMYTSPFLRCIQTAQHVAHALTDEQLLGYQEESQLREQDWGNQQGPGAQAKNYDDRLRYGRFFYRFPEGESAADVYDRLTLFQDHLVRDIACKRFAHNTHLLLITHGLSLRLFLMRWLHWTVDDFLQVFNPPTAVPIVLTRRQPPQHTDGNSSSVGNSACSSQLQLGPESIKSCYALTAESAAALKGVTPEMAAGRVCGTKQQLLAWRPYLKQVPPPPSMDPALEAALHELMEIGYGARDAAAAAGA